MSLSSAKMACLQGSDVQSSYLNKTRQQGSRLLKP